MPFIQSAVTNQALNYKIISMSVVYAIAEHNGVDESSPMIESV